MASTNYDIDPLARRSSYVSIISTTSTTSQSSPSIQKLIDYLCAESIRLLILDSHSRTLSASSGPSAIFGGALAGQDMPTLLVRAKQNVLIGLEDKLRMRDGDDYGMGGGEAGDRVKRMRQELSMAFVELDSRWRKWSEEATKPLQFA